MENPEGMEGLLGGDEELDLDAMSPEEMQRKIDELERAIASAEGGGAADASAAGASGSGEAPTTPATPKRDDPEIEKLRMELASLEEELQTMTGEGGGPGSMTEETSVYVGNVDYGASAEELQNFFLKCGDINRCTIMCNKTTGAPMGYAYIEFSKESSVAKALELNDSLFRGRQIKVSPKRVNVPGMGRTRGRLTSPPRRGYSPRRPRSRGYYPSYRSYSPRPYRPRRRISRGYHPYSAYY
eukprot:RCo000121